MGLFGYSGWFGSDKSNDTWAREYVQANIAAQPCQQTKAIADLQTEIAMTAESCASYVKGKRFGASRVNALSSCNKYIGEKYQCALDTAQASSYDYDNKIKAGIFNNINPIYYVIIFIVIAAIVFLMMY